MAEVKGVNKVIENLDNLRDALGDDTANALFKAGEMVRGTAIKSIQTVSTGKKVRRYRKGGASYDHIAAQAGSAPNTDTGALVRSIAVEPEGEAVLVGTSLEYGKFLEFGGRNDESGSPQYARPWLYPAKMANEKNIFNLLKATYKKALK